ncbi:hypothetical protein ZOD2009_17268 [Haladaptatus paucihalophilus DX253]|uniref:Uncharacterized protein n=1 Tax=Haladaptatus paucihalophilus DX253 TaxID=797209 RepID=E7QXB5_HALPU|nr:hypothetical protein ZOD2009_17268 [Haladaptatus paucihalophilus DX253]
MVPGHSFVRPNGEDGRLPVRNGISRPVSTGRSTAAYRTKTTFTMQKQHTFRQ